MNILLKRLADTTATLHDASAHKNTDDGAVIWKQSFITTTPFNTTVFDSKHTHLSQSLSAATNKQTLFCQLAGSPSTVLHMATFMPTTLPSHCAALLHCRICAVAFGKLLHRSAKLSMDPLPSSDCGLSATVLQQMGQYWLQLNQCPQHRCFCVRLDYSSISGCAPLWCSHQWLVSPASCSFAGFYSCLRVNARRFFRLEPRCLCC